MQTKIHLDFETYSELDLKRVGAFKYSEHESTEVLIMCWSYNDGPVHTWKHGDDTDSEEVMELFVHVRKGAKVGAHSAMFEYCIWNNVLARQFDDVPTMRVSQLDCTAARAAMCSLPRSLDKAGASLGLDITKDKENGKLLAVFSRPRKPTKRDARTRVMPRDRWSDFLKLVKYCRTDVSSERALDEELPPLPPFEVEAFRLNFRVNERGIPIDTRMVKRAMRVVNELESRVEARVSEMTGGIRHTQRDKLLAWLKKQGVELENLQAQTIKDYLENAQFISDDVRNLLTLRVEGSKASTKKLVSMLAVAMEDARARGCVLYYGAHTGREAGKIIQPQNFIRGLPEIDDQIVLMQQVFSLLKHKADADTFEMIYDNPLTSIAMCMRGFICANEGYELFVVDYAQIEARLLVWYAEQLDAIQEYIEYDAGRGHDRYVLMAAFLWNIKPEEVSKDQRRIAKNLVLGCGFQLGDKKFIVYCAKNGVVIDEDMSKRAVKAFREKHDKVPPFWEDVNRCAIASVRKPGQRVHLRNLSFYTDKDKKFLTIRLPSGRDLYYPYPKVQMKEIKSKKGTVLKVVPELTFMHEYFGAWIRQTTYGGRLVENIVQGTARDVMVTGAINAQRTKKYPIVLPVHDELLAEVRKGTGDIHELEGIVCEMPAWLKGCPIKSEGFVVERYRKG